MCQLGRYLAARGGRQICVSATSPTLQTCPDYRVTVQPALMALLQKMSYFCLMNSYPLVQIWPCSIPDAIVY